MPGLDLFDQDEGDTVFRDVIFLALAGFVAIVLLLLPFINPEAKENSEVNSPGNVIAEVRWPDDTNTDVDLWVAGPGDRPVGYSNKSGKIFNLLRDDLGTKGDITGLNYEVSYSRGVPAGEYVVNLHLYRSAQEYLPVNVTVAISIKTPEANRAKHILSKEVMMRQIGDEVTVFRFHIDDNGRLVDGSVHDLPRPLRSSKG